MLGTSASPELRTKNACHGESTMPDCVYQLDGAMGYPDIGSDVTLGVLCDLFWIRLMFELIDL